jgi:GH15 family glucan-1,4-alpha-glucosidase
MARDIPVGNGDILVTFDRLYRLRDIYSPFVGRYNHTDGNIQRFGVWADGQLRWIEEAGWTRELRYRPDTLVTQVTLHNEELGLQLECADCVDFHEPVYFRKAVVKNLLNRPRDVRLFYHWDMSIRGSPVGDTCNYDPATSSVVMYKDDSYFLFHACDQFKCGIDHWAIGTKRVRGAEGTWRDAEDGHLGRNAISQGSVDATIGFSLEIEPKGESYVCSWLIAGKSYDEVRKLNRTILEKGPERLMARTDSYWRLWARKEPIDASPLPQGVRDLFYRSQLVMRTQIDNRGAIIAANDSDITQFGGDHYSYCWPRDGALTAYALVQCGQSELSRNYFRYCGDIIDKDGFFLHKYTPAGELASSWHPWMVEGQRVLPVQQDQTALVVWALRQHFRTFRDVEFIKPLYASLVIKPAEWMLSYQDSNGLPNPSWDLWEERRGVHLFTVAATIGGLLAAADFARDFGEFDRAAAFREGAERMRAALLRWMYNPAQSAFARMVVPNYDGTYRLDMTADSANYALWAFGAFDVYDPKVAAEMRRLRDRLWIRTDIGGCARYEHDYYHQVESTQIDAVPGNPWVICTLWHAQYQIARARTITELEEALTLLEWTVKRAEKSGVLAEQFHPYTGEPMSVSPLTWSHATFAMTVVEYLRKHEKLRQMTRTISGISEPNGHTAASHAASSIIQG